MGGHHARHSGLDLLFVADVERGGVHLPAVFADLGGHLVELFLGASGDHHRGTQRGQFVRHTATNATAASCDHMDLTLEQAGTEDTVVVRRGGHGGVTWQAGVKPL